MSENSSIMKERINHGACENCEPVVAPCTCGGRILVGFEATDKCDPEKCFKKNDQLEVPSCRN